VQKDVNYEMIKPVLGRHLMTGCSWMFVVSIVRGLPEVPPSLFIGRKLSCVAVYTEI